MIQMCTDPSVYELDEYWKSQGLEDREQVRQELLWQASRRGEVPIHTGKCPACANLLASFQRMNGVLRSEGPVTVAVCPSAEDFSLYYYGEKKDEAIEEHLKTCTACREDLAFMARSQEPRERQLPLRRKLTWLVAACAALVFTLVTWGVGRKHEIARNFPVVNEFASLAQPPVVDRAELMAISAEDHHTRIDKVIELYDKRDYKTAAQYADVIYRTVDDAAAAYLLGMAQYKQGDLKNALESMRKAERMQPITEYRCWGALQMALMLGDKETIKRELRHLDNNKDYGDRCAMLRQKLEQRGFI